MTANAVANEAYTNAYIVAKKTYKETNAAAKKVYNSIISVDNVDRFVAMNAAQNCNIAADAADGVYKVAKADAAKAYYEAIHDNVRAAAANTYCKAIKSYIDARSDAIKALDDAVSAGNRSLMKTNDDGEEVYHPNDNYAVNGAFYQANEDADKIFHKAEAAYISIVSAK